MQHPALTELDREARVAFCREVVSRLSDLVEGEADEEICRRVDELVGDCQAFHAYKSTLARTIEIAGECGGADVPAPQLDNETFARCVERVRARLAE